MLFKLHGPLGLGVRFQPSPGKHRQGYFHNGDYKKAIDTYDDAMRKEPLRKGPKYLRNTKQFIVCFSVNDHNSMVPWCMYLCNMALCVCKHLSISFSLSLSVYIYILYM